MLKYKEKINEAIDFYADDNLERFDTLIKEIVKRLKDDLKEIHASDNKDSRIIAQIHYTWGFVLALNNEAEQALLRYEEALKNDPKNDEIVWEMVQIFLNQLYTPEPARKLLEERLLKNDPKNQEYKDALVLAKMSFNPNDTEEIKINNTANVQKDDLKKLKDLN